ncbi:MAG: hypothetical protein MZV49_05105, partial [Rhodopseudomonas palustris]|nr:hypothetical protein [Rhodopseudomonas palustris]
QLRIAKVKQTTTNGIDSTYDLKFNVIALPLRDRLNILLITGLPPFLSLALQILFLIQILKFPGFRGYRNCSSLELVPSLQTIFSGYFPRVSLPAKDSAMLLPGFT